MPGHRAEENVCDGNRANDYLTVTRDRFCLTEPVPVIQFILGLHF